MKIASAQIQVEKGNITQNLETHLRFAQYAAKHKVDLILFPEMSITGYCRAMASDLAMSSDDPRLLEFQELSNNHGITIILGTPTKLKDESFITSFIISPDREIKLYTKQYLHGNEKHFYIPSSEYDPKVLIDKNKASLAICADIDHSEHVKKAAAKNSDLYLASIFFTESGMEDGHHKLQSYAKDHNISILMSNYYGPQWNDTSGGRSAFWDQHGKKIGELNKEQEGLLIIQKRGTHYFSECHYDII